MLRRLFHLALFTVVIGGFLLGGSAVAEAGELVLRVDTDGLATSTPRPPRPGEGRRFTLAA